MQNIRLKKEMLVDNAHCNEGDVVRVNDARAALYIQGGYAEKAGDDVEVKNPDANPLADAIQPKPPEGANASIVDAIIPNVEDSPGLKALEEAATDGAPRRAKKVNA